MIKALERLLLISTFALTTIPTFAQLPGPPPTQAGSEGSMVTPAAAATGETGVRPAVPSKKYTTALDIELTALGMVTASYLDLFSPEEFLRILPSTGRQPLLAAPFQTKGKSGGVRVSAPGLTEPTMARQYTSDSSLDAVVDWYRNQYGFEFIVRRVAISDPTTDGIMTVARAVKRIDNTVISLVIWNPTQTRAPRRSKPGTFSHATTVAIQERSFRSREMLIPEGPDAVVELTWPVPYRELIQQVSARYQIDPFLIAALVQQESGFNATAISVDSAMGLTQMIPETAAMMGVSDANNPDQSLDGGARYLKLMLAKFSGNVMLALAAYNAGPGNVVKYGGIPPFAETRDYVRRIMDRYTEKATGQPIAVRARL